MKQVFTAFFVLFAAMYVAAICTLDRPLDPRFVHLRWSTDANPARVEQCSLFHTMYPADEVAVDTSADDISKVIVQCATNTGPDIIDVGSKQDMTMLVQAGLLLDLTPYAKAMGFDPTKTYPALKEALTVDGRQYRFPCNVWANCVIYNKQIFDRLGVPYPKPNWNYQDFVRTAQLIRVRAARNGETIMPCADMSDIAFYDDLLVGYGGQMFSKDGLVSALDDRPSVDAMQFYRDLIYKYRVLADPAETASLSSQGGWGSASLDWFSSGRAAMLPIGRWYIVQVPNWPNLKGHLGAVLLPRVGDRPSSGETDTRAAAINAKSPNWRAALNFLQYLASPQYSRLVVEDGDSLPPDPDLARTGQALVDSYVPDPAFHAPFIQAETNARVLNSSPFIDSSEVGRWLTVSIQQVENQTLSPAQALHALAAQIDEGIRTNLERRPDLQRKYEQVTGRRYTRNWWRAYPGFASM